MKYTDSLEMKVEFIYELLLSIRGDFSKDSALEERKDLAVKLTKLAIKEFNERAKFVKEYGDSNYYGTVEYNKNAANKLITLEKTINKFIPHKDDGRYFRSEFPYGYIDMLKYFHFTSDNVVDINDIKLSALEIIKNTRVDTGLIKLSKDYDDYCGLEACELLNGKQVPKQKGITLEEYELLKVVLK